ncbi:uncharacterized protein PADG_11551 [Paracoccidioides brasiliensis Pb18]|uniref:Uncharacterized protein n=1 Tax=Paracoccidioides brasiliensis (strain Pb18) TaxID=502780 RepID=A0A0A0HUR7_PARBD|nr:uncharacterized protein PADG_11551 [Paracoccidioides brasiliensis Pb18]KGM92352.1 hypothetical protein PADG_11551 [Paracoccidioides brasiliensis Pb18]
MQPTLSTSAARGTVNGGHGVTSTLLTVRCPSKVYVLETSGQSSPPDDETNPRKYQIPRAPVFMHTGTRSSVGPWHFLNYFSCRPQPNKESAAGAHCPQGLHSKPDRHQEHTRGLSLLSSPGIDRAQPGRTSAHTKGTSTQDSNHVSWTT